MGMDFECTHRATVTAEGEFNRDESSCRTMRLELTVKVVTLNWTSHYHHEQFTEFLGQEGPSIYRGAAVAVAGVPKSLTRGDIKAAVRRAAYKCGYPLPYAYYRLVIERTWKAASTIFEADKTLANAGGVVKLACVVREVHNHVYGGEMEPPAGMVPAAEPSLELLEKREVGEAAEFGCSICLEEVGGEAVAMPCLHAFHGGCIEKWLRISHYCPLCRYKMPTATDPSASC